ncbi:replication initiator protein A [Priestia megaterium]
MKKNYITKAYINMLNDKEKATGVYFTTPKVIVKGDKYRKALNPTEKLIYQELWDMTKKAIHKGQVDEKGRAYVEASYTFLATAIGVDPSTIERTLTKRKGLFHTGLLAIKKHGNSTTTEYYVMAPVYEGADEMYLANDGATDEMKSTVDGFKKRKNSNKSTKRETENEQLAEQRKSDTIQDTAHYDVIKREEVSNTPDGIESEQEQQEATEKENLQEYESIMKEAKALGVKFRDTKRMNELIAIVNKHLGVGKRFINSTVEDLSALRLCYEEMKRKFHYETEMSDF